jgi:glycosyltransferase involved in cell wall biosynthesis
MNILRLTTRIYPDEGGPAVFSYYLSKFISKQNHRVFNIACKPQNINIKNQEVSQNFIIHYLPIRIPSKNSGYFKKIIFIMKFCLYSIRTIYKIHKKYRIDIIHCDNPSITGLVSVFFKKIFKIPFVYTQHGLDSPYKLDYLFELKLIYPNSAYYLIISREMMKHFVKNKINTEKLLWFPNGIELNEFFHIQNNREKQQIINELKISSIIGIKDYIIIYVGYMIFLQKVKGMIDFLYGFNTFLNNVNDSQKDSIKLLYIGDGEYRKTLENEIDKLDLRKNVILLGKRSKLEKFYAIADLCGLTSYIEGFPTVLLESIASNVPCIATNVGEVNEILVDEMLVPVGDRDKIAYKLQDFFNDRNLTEKLSEISREKIKKYDWNILAKKIIKIYRKSV